MRTADTSSRSRAGKARLGLALVALVLICGANLPWLKRLPFFGSESERAVIPAEAMRRVVEPLPGESLFQDYGSPGSTPERDLDVVAHAFENLRLLVKGRDAFRMGANEEFAAALRGTNRTQLRFLPDEHSAFNAAGQIVDRWGTPLFFHVEGADRVDVRSAGPDREMWTGDDLHRRHNGRFHRGDDLPKAAEGRGL